MITTVLVRTEDVHRFLVYSISKVLQNDEQKFSKIEKLIFALIVVARKLCPYFQAHPLIVMKNQPYQRYNV